MKKILVACICHNGDRLAGYFTDKLAEVNKSDDDIIFEGCVWWWNKKAKEYQLQGERAYTRKSFYKEVKHFTDVF